MYCASGWSFMSYSWSKLFQSNHWIPPPQSKCPRLELQWAEHHTLSQSVFSHIAVIVSMLDGLNGHGEVWPSAHAHTPCAPHTNRIRLEGDGHFVFTSHDLKNAFSRGKHTTPHTGSLNDPNTLPFTVRVLVLIWSKSKRMSSKTVSFSQLMHRPKKKTAPKPKNDPLTRSWPRLWQLAKAVGPLRCLVACGEDSSWTFVLIQSGYHDDMAQMGNSQSGNDTQDRTWNETKKGGKKLIEKREWLQFLRWYLYI